MIFVVKFDNLGVRAEKHPYDQCGDAYRVVYALQIGDDIWVVHAFQKKSKSGIKTPAPDIGLVRERLKRPREMLK